MDVLRIMLAIILPPVGVAMQVGLTAQFWINVVLTPWGISRALSTHSGSS